MLDTKISNTCHSIIEALKISIRRGIAEYGIRSVEAWMDAANKEIFKLKEQLIRLSALHNARNIVISLRFKLTPLSPERDLLTGAQAYLDAELMKIEEEISSLYTL